MTLDIALLGFDLDKTLYKPDPKIDERIQEYICRKASEILGVSYNEAKRRFHESYSKTQSGTLSLNDLGIENGFEIVQEALENADVASVLERDGRLIEMLNRLSVPYRLFLLTSSNQDSALKKLSALGINPKIFSPAFYGYPPSERVNGLPFPEISRQYGVPFERMMFVGDRENVDIIPAKQLGIKTAIVHGKSSEADYQLDEIYDLEIILNL